MYVEHRYKLNYNFKCKFPQDLPQEVAEIIPNFVLESLTMNATSKDGVVRMEQPTCAT
jgi:hypothetical protein